MRGLFRRIAVVTSGALLLQGLAVGVALAGSAPVLKWSPSASGTFSYGTVSSGQSLAQVFTLTNTGKKATGSLSVKLTGAAFAVTKDSCARVRLRPHRTCKVTVAFSPKVNGQKSAGTLTAVSTKPAVKASLALKGTAAKKPATISARPGKGGTVGVASVTDTAMLSGGVAPTGTVSFALHGPSSTAKCSGSPVFSRQVPVKGDGSYAPPAGVTLSMAGIYWWTVSYSGDARNNQVATKCGAESVSIVKALPGIAATANPVSGPTGTLLKATATLTGGDHPAGAIEFRLYPAAAGCSGPPADDETVSVSADGKYSTPAGFTASTAGTYEWTAVYLGNANNATIGTVCGAAPVVIGHPVGSEPAAIAFDGTNMWVANFGSANVTELSPSGQSIATVSVGDNPDGIAFDHTNMWVANSGSGNVTEISPAGLVLRTVGVGRFPTGVAFDGTNIWVAIGGSGNVTELSPTGTFLGAFTVGSAPQGIAFDGTNMWVTNTSSGNVTKLSPTGQVLGTFPVGMNPEAIAFDGTNMWVTNAASDNVTELSPTGQVLRSPGVGSEPEAIAFDGTNLWVANAGSDNVTELSLAGKVLGTFPAGSSPDAIASDGTNLWIPDSDSDDVIEIPAS